MSLRDLLSKLPGRARKIAAHKATLELPVAPVLLMATGAGVAVWWWTQWARGRAESEATAPPEAAPGPGEDEGS
jgi:hypothetical protein